ncbi:hypothetical protein EV363DRAFT_1431740 [Boletus edulis]|nr:hypothetical protein EV363DRAFT_1431740 [Boletus edulis]
MLFNADQTNNAVPPNQSLRLDGRDQLEIRTPTITFGPDPGWLRRIADRTTLASVASHPVSLLMSTVKPPPERSFEGMITIHSEMSPMASVDYELVHCLADTGNMLDSACLAGITLEVIGDVVVVACTSPGMWFSFIHVAHMHAPEERVPVPLAIHHTPFCVTFAFFPDPTTRLSAGAMSIQREICVLHKAGGMLTAPDEILNVAVGIAKELDQLVEARLREDWAERKVEVR